MAKIENGVLRFNDDYLNQKMRRKGHEILDFLSDYTMIDIETTGLSPFRDRVTELSGIRVRAGKIVAQYSNLVKYPGDNSVPTFLTKLNGIDQALIESEGIDVAKAISEFRKFIGDDVIVGYNINFDLNFVYDLCQKYHLSKLNNNYVDVLRFSRVFFKQEAHNRLIDCLRRLNISPSEAHRGLQDSIDTKSVYDVYHDQFTPRMLSELKLKSCDLAELPFEYKLGRNPVKNKVITLAGQAKNQELANVITTLGGTVTTLGSNSDYLIIGDHDYFKRQLPELKQLRELKQAGNKISQWTLSFFLSMLDSWARS